MATICDLCGKRAMAGRNIRHQHTGRWERKAPKTNRQFRANVHKQVIWRDGKKEKLAICTRCLRSQVKVAAS